MPLPFPWTAFESSLTVGVEFPQGAERIADFFRATEEKGSPAQLLQSLMEAGPDPKWWERFFFCLLDIGISDQQAALRTLEAKRLHRLLLRTGKGSDVGAKERILAHETIEKLSLRSPKDLHNRTQSARETLSLILNDGKPTDEQRGSLIFLLRSEAKALRERVDWLSENADPYNLKTMARVLPRLRIYDENVETAVQLAQRLEKQEPIGNRMLSFEMAMGPTAMAKWLKGMEAAEKVEELRPVLEAIQLQREKKVPTLDLMALSSLWRWLGEASGRKSTVQDWVLSALRCYHKGSFQLDAGEGVIRIWHLIHGSGANVAGTVISGNFTGKVFPGWIGRDLLTRPFRKSEEEAPDIKTLVMTNITRDAILESLLNNAKVFQKPGVVSFIAATCRSVSILTRIAKSRNLHTGFANRDVPLALLESPCNIPMSLLRPFINTRYVSLLDLKQLEKKKSGLRRDVQAEVVNYLGSRG